MFDEALGRLQALGFSATAILPGLLLGLGVLGLGPGVTRAASLREAWPELAASGDERL
ncbi:MAG TPA: hypothetical protein VIL69_17225 [Roseomonas sp.]